MTTSATKKVCGGLHGRRESPAGQRLDRDRHGARLGERVERGGEAFVDEHGGVDPARELAQLGKGGAQFRLGRVEAPSPVVIELGAEEPEREREHDEPLLGAIVQVALKPAAHAVAGLDRASARRPQLLELRARVGLKALTVECQAGRGADALEQPRIVDQLGPVDENGDRRSAPHERSHRAPVRLRQLDRVAALVDVEPAAERVGDQERGIVERAGEQVAERVRRGRVTEFDDQARDGRSCPPPRAQVRATPSDSAPSAAAWPSQSRWSTLSFERNPRSRLYP